jgi:2-amino-4-hydroxy-6-hydroxymethyldihydropteridine diphosphokinase
MSGARRKGVRAALGLGSNVGERRAALEGAVSLLRVHESIEVLAVSSLIETDAVGPPGQGPYLNGAVVVRTRLAPLALLDACQAIELRLGRDRRRETRWGPRTIDIDILLYGQRIVDVPRLRVPHPRLAERPFVLIPLAEIADSWVHPETGARVQSLLRALSAAPRGCS